MHPLFSQSQVEAIAAALGDTDQGLTGSEITHLLRVCGVPDATPQITKRHRLHNAFAASQNSRRDRKAVLAFIRTSMKPERYLGCAERFEAMRANLNRALAFAGLAVDASGILAAADPVTTIADAERRAQDLRQDLARRGVHPDVLLFCKSELVVDDYFHAVLEAMKSVAEKLRNQTGLADDGAVLIDRALGGDPPMLAINTLKTDSERSEQRGFAQLVRWIFRYVSEPNGAHRAHPLVDGEGGCRGPAVGCVNDPPTAGRSSHAGARVRNGGHE
jgi:uncharacterized protein (TIGR02391 family)